MLWKRIRIEIKGIVAICIATLLLIIIGVGWFYWYEWRPSQIRKDCYNSVITNPFSTESEQKNEFESQYQNCLHENGLEK